MIDVVKIILPAALAFFVGIGITPYVAGFLYKNKMWKKKSGKVDRDGNETPIFNELHKNKEVGTPRMGGVIIWGSAFIVVMLIWFLSQITPFEIFNKLDFLSRNQTWIPFMALLIGALVGLLDDWMEIKGSRDIESNFSGGLSAKKRLLVVGLIAIFVASWFVFKLDVVTIGLPFMDSLYVGWFLIPIFTIIMIIIYSGGVIDGLDGLSGGVLASMFGAYSVIAFSLNQIDLAAFCATIMGAILAFLWFNIPPARFYMSETGSMALTIVLSIVALMTDALGDGIGLFVLPIIAFPLIATAGSSAIQIASKRIRGKKIFLSAPLHHHFEAIGWPAYKVTMRYWILSVIFAITGIIIALSA